MQRPSVTAVRKGSRRPDRADRTPIQVHDPTGGGGGANQPSPPAPRPQRFFVSDFFSCVPAARRGAARPQPQRTGPVGRGVGDWAEGRVSPQPAVPNPPPTASAICDLPPCLPARPSGTTPPRTHTHSCTCPSAPLRCGGDLPPAGRSAISFPFIYSPSLPLSLSETFTFPSQFPLHLSSSFLPPLLSSCTLWY
jgi:hypothetical protein